MAAAQQLGVVVAICGPRFPAMPVQSKKDLGIRLAIECKYPVSEVCWLV